MKKIILTVLILTALFSASCSFSDTNEKSELLFSSVRKSFYCASGAITSAIKPIERDDPNFSKASWCRRLQLNDEETYYQNKGSFLFYLDPEGDISDYIQTGYLRFFIDVPKSMYLQLSVNNENWASTPKYTFFADTEKAVDGFIEIIIPFKDLIANASASFDPSKIKNINMTALEDASPETFLSNGQQIHIMPFEFWSAYPEPAQEYDYYNIFYCGSGNGIEVWDKNGILPETIVVNAYKNTIDIDAAKEKLDTIVPQANFINLYTIQLINDSHRIVEVYDTKGEIEIAIPSSEFSYSRYIRAVVVGREEIKEVNLSYENDFTIIKTDTLGDFIFFTGNENSSETKNPLNNYLSLQIDVNHLGIPSFDAEYNFKVAEFKDGSGKLLDADEYTLFCDIAEIEISGGKITVPAEFKDNTQIQGVKIYAKKNNDPNITGYYPLMIKNWTQTFNDDFDGAELDESKWPYEKNIWNPLSDIGEGKTIAKSRDAIYIEDGKCILKVEKGDGKEVYHQGNLIESADYVFGSMSTQNAFSQQFGCFTTSVRLPFETRAGNNAAFWLLIQDEGYATSYFFRYRDTAINKNNYCAEIDIMECSSAWEPQQYQITEHFWHKNTLEHSSDFARYIDENLFNGEYAEISCVWTENALYYYYNGKLVKEVKNIEAYEDNEAYIIWDFYASGYGEENSTWVGNFTDDDLDKMNISIDYVRAYK